MTRMPNGGLRLAFTSEELSSVRYNGRTGRPRRGERQRLWSTKVMGLVLKHFHDVSEGEVDDVLTTCRLLRLHLPPQRSIRRRPFNLLKIDYKLSRRSRTVHTRYFYFEVEEFGKSGWLYPYQHVISHER